MRRLLSLCLMHGFVIAADAAADDTTTKTNATNGFMWRSVVPAECPFERSPTLAWIFFTGRHSDYRAGDTFYPSWASDGNLYSPWTDGITDGVKCTSGGSLANGFRTGHAVLLGDDPLKLTIRNTSPPNQALAAPYRGRYPYGSLVHDGIWYFGTYCLGPAANYPHVVNSDMHKEADWLMNESGDMKRIDAVKSMTGKHARLITCLARWNGQDATKVVPQAFKAGIGLYGFTVPRNNSGLVPLDGILSRPVSELQGDDRNIAVLTRAYTALPSMSLEMTRASSLSP